VETVIVGARGSRLAQVMVQELISHLGSCPVVGFKARSVMTDGDKDRKTPVRALGGGGGGVFTTRLEEELLAGRVDVAVHSLKDLPTAPPDGLVLAVTPPRADPLDALCGSTLSALRPGARVGTGSARRVAQLKALRQDLEVVPIRGNVPARLAKLKSGLDAVIHRGCVGSAWMTRSPSCLTRRCSRRRPARARWPSRSGPVTGSCLRC
jgi:hydroxymethylbilane synthase